MIRYGGGGGGARSEQFNSVVVLVTCKTESNECKRKRYGEPLRASHTLCIHGRRWCYKDFKNVHVAILLEPLQLVDCYDNVCELVGGRSMFAFCYNPSPMYSGTRVFHPSSYPSPCVVLYVVGLATWVCRCSSGW